MSKSLYELKDKIYQKSYLRNPEKIATYVIILIEFLFLSTQVMDFYFFLFKNVIKINSILNRNHPFLNSSSNLYFSLSSNMKTLSNDFYDSSYFSQIKYLINGSCHLCTFNVTNSYTPQSTERDIIFAEAFRNPIVRNIFELTHVLRTVKSRALFLIFSDENVYSGLRNSSYFNELLSCHCFIINTGPLRPYVVKSYFLHCCTFRYILIDGFLNHYSSYFDRACHVDLYDTIFQADPFNQYYDPNLILLTSQHTTFFNSYVDRKWLDRWRIITHIYEHDQRFLPLPILNGGFFLGSVSHFQKMLKVFLKHFYSVTLMVSTKDDFDQGLFSLLYYSGIFEQNEIHLKPFYPLTIYSSEPRYISDSPFGSITHPNVFISDSDKPNDPNSRHVLVMMHHYSHYKQLTQKVYSVCPYYAYRYQRFKKK